MIKIIAYRILGIALVSCILRIGCRVLRRPIGYRVLCIAYWVSCIVYWVSCIACCVVCIVNQVQVINASSLVYCVLGIVSYPHYVLGDYCFVYCVLGIVTWVLSATSRATTLLTAQRN